MILFKNLFKQSFILTEHFVPAAHIQMCLHAYCERFLEILTL